MRAKWSKNDVEVAVHAAAEEEDVAVEGDQREHLGRTCIARNIGLQAQIGIPDQPEHQINSTPHGVRGTAWRYPAKDDAAADDDTNPCLEKVCQMMSMTQIHV